jgi:hypothetical protein
MLILLMEVMVLVFPFANFMLEISVEVLVFFFPLFGLVLPVFNTSFNTLMVLVKLLILFFPIVCFNLPFFFFMLSMVKFLLKLFAVAVLVMVLVLPVLGALSIFKLRKKTRSSMINMNTKRRNALSGRQRVITGKKDIIISTMSTNI